MRVIDDSGFVFGRVNVIDGLVVVLASAILVAGGALVSSDPLAGLPGGLFGVIGIAALAYYSPDAKTRAESSETTRVDVLVRSQPLYVVSAIQVGDRTVEDDVVVRGRDVRAARTIVETDDGRVVEDTHPQLRTLHLDLELDLDSATTREFRGQRVRIGRELTLDFDHVQVDGTVVSLDGTPEPEQIRDEQVASPELGTHA